MLITIDRRRQMIVDMSSFEEVAGAIAVDLDARSVVVAERTSKGEVQTERHYPAGVRIIKRY